MAHLESIITEEILSLFPQNMSADLWKALEERYQRYDAVDISFLESKLRKANLESGAEPQGYVDELRAIFNQLSLAGQVYSEAKKGQILLDGLPKEYLPFIMSIRGRRDVDDKHLEFEWVARSVMHTAQDLARAGMLGRAESKLMVTKEKNMRRPGRCNNCQGRGHWARDCKKPKRYHKPEGAANKINKEDTARRESNGFIFSTTKIKDKNVWYFDGGASYHVTWNKASFTTYTATERYIEIADGSKLKVCGIGDIKILVNVDDKKSLVTLKNVRHVPKANCQLISEVSLIEEGCNILKRENILDVNNGSVTLLQGRKQKEPGSLFILETWEGAMIMEEKVRKITLIECHKALSHLNKDAIIEMVSKGRCEGIRISSMEWKTCDSCAKMKATKSPQPKEATRKAKFPGDIISLDVCGPITPASVGNAKYVSVAIDHFTCLTDVKLLETKSSVEILDHVKEFILAFQRQTGKLVKTVRSDNGSEYTSSTFKEFIKSQGITHETTSPYTPAQNGKVERKIRTLIEAARTMVEESGLPKPYWGEAVMNACYTQNRLPHTALLGKTPFEMVTGRVPHLAHLRSFGAKCWALSENQRFKMDAKATECIFLGYYKGSKAYRLMDTRTKKSIKSIHVEFEEQSNNSIIQRNSITPLNDKEITEEVQSPEEWPVEEDHDTNSSVTKEFRPKRESAKKADKLIKSLVESKALMTNEYEGAINDPLANNMMLLAQTVDSDTLTLREAKSSEEWPYWQKAIKEEFK